MLPVIIVNRFGVSDCLLHKAPKLMWRCAEKCQLGAEMCTAQMCAIDAHRSRVSLDARSFFSNFLVKERCSSIFCKIFMQ
jgi:hypothetical protein